MKCVLLIIMLIISNFIFSQEYEKGVFEIKVISEDAKPSKLKQDGEYTQNEKLNLLFKKHQVTLYEQAVPFAKNPELLKLYIVKIKGNDYDFKKDLNNTASNLVTNVTQIPKPILTYEPSDYMWYLPTQEDPNGWLWHLKRIEAAKAWDITKSNSNITIADIDTDFDLSHPDLTSKISPNYDPMTNIIHSKVYNSHGTITASFAAAQTDGGGQLASIGFNSRIIAYTYENGINKALHASDVMHADVITISWFNSCSPPSQDDINKIKEILDNGTIIVASAGNGSIHCNGDPIYPFSPLVDSRIICVSSTGIDDKHQYIDNGVDKTHSGYSSVSICAPGYNVMGATSTINSDGTTKEWPYSGTCSGTSFATPIVAGVCALMKSINPCLTPAMAKSIIINNADPIIDASSYPGMVGAGRINAYKCVKAAGTKSVIGTIGGTTTYSAGYGAYLNNVTVQSNSNITITARNEIKITGSFNVPLGSTLKIVPVTTSVNSCN